MCSTATSYPLTAESVSFATVLKEERAKTTGEPSVLLTELPIRAPQKFYGAGNNPVWSRRSSMLLTELPSRSERVRSLMNPTFDAQ